MRKLTLLALAAVAGIGFTVMTPKAEAQVSLNLNLGAAPECPYGYYDTTPYGCAPSGYYGPEWFAGGEFTGAGPWFHGDSNFRGNVNNTYHPSHGYKGPVPARGEKAEPAKRVDNEHFHGNEVRDGRGHEAEGKR